LRLRLVVFFPRFFYSTCFHVVAESTNLHVLTRKLNLDRCLLAQGFDRGKLKLCQLK
jgi:hypothetical protein